MSDNRSNDTHCGSERVFSVVLPKEANTLCKKTALIYINLLHKIKFFLKYICMFLLHWRETTAFCPLEIRAWHPVLNHLEAHKKIGPLQGGPLNHNSQSDGNHLKIYYVLICPLDPHSPKSEDFIFLNKPGGTCIALCLVICAVPPHLSNDSGQAQNNKRLVFTKGSSTLQPRAANC